MARFSVGDLVYHNNLLHVVNEVRGVLGFNLYTVMSTEDGRTTEVPGTALQPAHVTLMAMDDVDEWMEETSKSRFVEADENAINEIASNVSSKNTKKATKWGVKILRGMIIVENVIVKVYFNERISTHYSPDIHIGSIYMIK